MIIIDCMKASGNVIIDMGKDIKNFLINVYIKVIISMGNLKELGDIVGLMENFMKENGLMGWSKVQECGEVQRGIHILDNGSLEKQMAMEFIHG